MKGFGGVWGPQVRDVWADLFVDEGVFRGGN